MKETAIPQGFVHAVLTGPDGKVKEERMIPNLVVNNGKAHFVSRADGTSQAVMSHIAIGTSSSAAVVTQSALLSEVDRNTATRSIVTQDVANDTLQMVATFAPGEGTGNITEAGIFNAASAGVMLARTVFTAIPKGANDTLSFTWKVKIA